MYMIGFKCKDRRVSEREGEDEKKSLEPENGRDTDSHLPLPLPG